MNKSTSYLLLSASILFLFTAGNMPLEAIIFTTSAFFTSMVLYFFTRCKEITPDV